MTSSHLNRINFKSRKKKIEKMREENNFSQWSRRGWGDAAGKGEKQGLIWQWVERYGWKRGELKHREFEDNHMYKKWVQVFTLKLTLIYTTFQYTLIHIIISLISSSSSFTFTSCKSHFLHSFLSHMCTQFITEHSSTPWNKMPAIQTPFGDDDNGFL